MSIRSKLSRIIHYIYTRNFTRKLNEKYYLCSRGIGDTTIFMSRLTNMNVPINIVIAKNQVPLVDVYRKYVKNVIVLPTKKINALTSEVWENPQNKLQFILPPGASMYLGYRNLSIWDLINVVLKIPVENNEYVEPGFKWSNKRKNECLSSLGIMDKKFVFIAPDAVSVSATSSEVWRKIVEECHINGYEVLENASSGVIQYGDKNVFLPIDETYLLAKEAQMVFSARSGLSDLLAFSKCKLIVVYPEGGSERILFTFKNMPFSKHVIEIDESEIDIVKKIIEGDNEN